MSFMEKLRVLIDVDSKGATTGIGGFRNAVRDADGFTGKFKAGANSAMQSVKANAAALAVTGGAALVAFGAKALAAFEDSAKAAIDFGKATGLSTEAASRWIAVADDYSVSADALQAAIGRASKKGLDFVDVMVQINEAAPGERARVGAELLGKSWQSVAPLLGKTRAEYEAMLAAVGEGQVITEKEAAKAERMRLAQDNLKDALDRVTMAVGEYVAGMAPQIEAITDVIGFVSDLTDEYGEYIDTAEAIVNIGNPFGWLKAADVLIESTSESLKGMPLAAFKQAMDDLDPSAADAVAWMERWRAANEMSGLSLDDLSRQIFGVDTATLTATDAIKNGTTAVIELGDGGKETAQASYELEAAQAAVDQRLKEVKRDAGYAETALRNLQNQIDGDQSWNDLQLNLLGVSDQLAAAKKQFDEGGLSAEEYALTVNGIMLGAKSDISDYLIELEGVPREVIAQILSEFDPNDPAKTIAALQAEYDKHSVTIKAVVGGNAYGSTGRGGEQDSPGVSGYSPVSGGDTTVNTYVVLDGKVLQAISKKLSGNSVKGSK